MAVFSKKEAFELHTSLELCWLCNICFLLRNKSSVQIFTKILYFWQVFVNFWKWLVFLSREIFELQTSSSVCDIFKCKLLKENIYLYFCCYLCWCRPTSVRREQSVDLLSLRFIIIHLVGRFLCFYPHHVCDWW